MYITVLSAPRSPIYLGLVLFLFTTKTGSFFSTGEDSLTLVFFTGLDLEFKASFKPLTCFEDFVLGLDCVICLELRGFLGDSKLEVPLSGSSSGKASSSDACLFKARAFRGLVDGLEDNNFSAATKGERRCGLFGGDEAFFFCNCLLSLTNFCLDGDGDDFLDDFAGDSSLSFFDVVCSVELAGLPLFLAVGCSSAGLAKPLSCVSEASSSSSSAWVSFIFSLKAFLDVFELLPLDFTCDFLSLLADVFDEAFEGAGFDSTVPPFFGPFADVNWNPFGR